MSAADDEAAVLARARLDPLRTELGQIDREILELVARRQVLAQKIGQVKRDAGIPHARLPAGARRRAARAPPRSSTACPRTSARS